MPGHPRGLQVFVTYPSTAFPEISAGDRREVVEQLVVSEKSFFKSLDKEDILALFEA